MHWRQREMLFEQTEALKESTGTMRKKKSGKKGNEIARKGARGSDMGGDTPKPPSGKKYQRFEDSGVSSKGGSKSERRPIGKRRRPGGAGGGGGFGNNPGGKESGRRPTGRRRGAPGTGGGLGNRKESHCEAYAEAYVRGVEQALYESTPIPPSAVIIDANAVNSLNSVIAEYNALIAQGADPAFALASAGTPNGMVNIGGYSIPLTAFVSPNSPRGTIQFISLRQFIGSALSEIGIDLSGMNFNDPMATRPYRPGENFTGRRPPRSQFGPPAQPAPRQDPRMNVKAPPPMRPGPAG